MLLLDLAKFGSGSTAVKQKGSLNEILLFFFFVSGRKCFSTLKQIFCKLRTYPGSPDASLSSANWYVCKKNSKPESYVEELRPGPTQPPPNEEY
jgi:hypothetical protein